MISPVSFGSTYKIKLNKSCDSQYQKTSNKISNFCEENHIPCMEQQSITIPTKPYEISSYNTDITIVAKDSLDKNLETFLGSSGIKFNKYSTADIMDPQHVKNRVQNAPKGYRKAFVDSEKLDKLLERQPESNFEHCQSDYDKYYKETADFVLKSKDEFPAPTLFINTCCKKEDVLDYVEKYGSDKLNPDTLIIDLCQRTDYPDHCMYFAMKDKGLKEIPVYVNKDSYELGNALGILK